jgi:hypothetical protein
MGISLTDSEARALRDAIRTDYAAREEAAADGDAEQAHRLRILDDADGVLRTVYMYEDEIAEALFTVTAPTYYRVVLDVPVYPGEDAPETWSWVNMIDCTDDVHVVESRKIDTPEEV